MYAANDTGLNKQRSIIISLTKIIILKMTTKTKNPGSCGRRLTNNASSYQCTPCCSVHSSATVETAIPPQILGCRKILFPSEKWKICG